MSDKTLINFEVGNPVLYDKIYETAKEYDMTVDFLINIAVFRLLNDIEVFRNLINGKYDFKNDDKG